MELLIPGLLLVAFMVWASTRIKKNAAAAFDAETIEANEFIIQKPEGFLHNLNGSPKYIFEAYSKDFSKANDKLRVGTATITRIADMTLDQVISGLSETDDLIDEGNETLQETAYHRLRRSDDETEISYKLTERDGNIYKLEITAIGDAANDQWVETFFDSFRVK